MVTAEADTAEAFAVSTPALPIAIAPPLNGRFVVASVVTPPPPCTVRVPDQVRPFVAIEKVTVDAPLLKVTL